MAILCLSDDYADLKARLGRILMGFGRDGVAVRSADLRAEGAMAVLLRDAVLPNLVQTPARTRPAARSGSRTNAC